MYKEKFVDEEKKVVVVKFANCEDDFIFWCQDHGITLPYEWVDGLAMPNSFVGKATCADCDEYDSVLGIKLAEKRARKKYIRSWKRKATRLRNLVAGQLDKFQESYYVTATKMDKSYERLEDSVSWLEK